MDGTISFWKKGKKPKGWKKPQPSALPVFSVDTEEQAKAIMVRFCRLQYDGRMTWTNFGGTLEELDGVACRMQSFLNQNA